LPVIFEDALAKNECDFILISPERLNNEHFFKQAILVGLLPFLIGDVFKIGVAALALPAAWKLAGNPDRPV
jgi:biotin transporter BioY